MVWQPKRRALRAIYPWGFVGTLIYLLSRLLPEAHTFLGGGGALLQAVALAVVWPVYWLVVTAAAL